MAEPGSCKRAWLGLVPKSEQERIHVELGMANGVIDLGDNRKIGEL